jgi:hypothetical protein
LTGHINSIPYGSVISLVGAILSSVLGVMSLGLNLYTKNYDLGQIAQKHKDAADKLWNIRESYLSLLTDIASGSVSIDKIKSLREELQKKLATVYSGAPRTNGDAYKQAQAALKQYEDMTFSDAEIDAFLPAHLHRVKPH